MNLKPKLNLGDRVYLAFEEFDSWLIYFDIPVKGVYQHDTKNGIIEYEFCDSSYTEEEIIEAMQNYNKLMNQYSSQQNNLPEVSEESIITLDQL